MNGDWSHLEGDRRRVAVRQFHLPSSNMYLAKKTKQPAKLLPFVTEWLSLLCRCEYKQASELLYQAGEWPWTGDQLQKAIETDNYGVEECGFYKATPYESAEGQNPREYYDEEVPPGDKCYLHPEWPIQITFFGEERSSDRPSVSGNLRIHYALNGSWTDISSNFFIHDLPDGVAFELCSIEVE